MGKKRSRDLAFGQNLARLRRARGWTQDELAAQAKVGASLIRRYETGNVNPSVVSLRNLARVLGVSTDALVFKEGEGLADTKITDSDLLRYFEQVNALPDGERLAVKVILESVVVRHKIAGLLDNHVETPSQVATRAVDIAVDRIAKAITKQSLRERRRTARQ